MLGDVDNDNDITAKDVAYVLQKVLNANFKLPIEKLVADYLKFADVNKDGVITIDDASMILQKVLNKDFVFHSKK